MKRLIVLLLCLFAVACNACTSQRSPLPPPSATPVPTVVVPDAGPAMGGASPVLDAGPEPDADSGVRSACQNLQKLGCPEANPLEFCLRVTQRVLVENLTIVPLACMVGAKNKSDVAHCGFVGCK